MAQLFVASRSHLRMIRLRPPRAAMTEPVPDPAPSRLARVRQLFERAQQLPPADRLAFVQGAAGTDEDLVAAVMALLGALSQGRTTWLAGGARSALDAAAAEPMPERIGPYRLLARLGAGGMGIVYRAEQDGPERRLVAIKVAQARFAAPSHLDRFVREAQLAATIEHPNCVFVFGGGQFEGRPYLAMELLSGRSLATLVEERGPLPPADALRLLLDVCDGLQAIHDADIVHRDVKPSNCLLSDAGVVKVADFGLSSTRTELLDPEARGCAVGTRAFAAPEQLRGEAVDARADVHAATATLCYLLTGEVAKGDALTVALAKRVGAAAVGETPVDAEALLALLRTGMADDVSERMGDIGELRAGIEALLQARREPASRWVRSVAFAVDWVVIEEFLSWLRIGWGLLGADEGAVGGHPLWRLVPSGLLAWAYFTLAEGPLGGATIGKSLAGIAVVPLHGSRRIGLVRSATRSVFLAFFVSALLGPAVIAALAFYILLACDPEVDMGPLLDAVLEVASFSLGVVLPVALLFCRCRRTPGQGWHDRLAKTVVVRRANTHRNRQARLTPIALAHAAERAEVDPFLQRTVLVVLDGDHLNRPASPRVVSRETRGNQQVALVAVPLGLPWAQWLGAGCGSWADTCKVLTGLADEVVSAGDTQDSLELEVDQLVVGHGGRLVRLPIAATEGTTGQRPIAASWLAARCEEVLSSRGLASPLAVRLAMKDCLAREDLPALRQVLVDAAPRTVRLDRRRRAMAAALAALLLFAAAVVHTFLLGAERTVTLQRAVRGIQDLQRLSVCLEESVCRASLLADVGQQPALVDDWTRALGRPWTFWPSPPPDELAAVVKDLEHKAQEVVAAAQRRARDYTAWEIDGSDERAKLLLQFLDGFWADSRREKILNELLRALKDRLDGQAASTTGVRRNRTWERLRLDILWAVHLMATGQDPLSSPRLYEHVSRHDFSEGRYRWAGISAGTPAESAALEMRIVGDHPEVLSSPWVTWWPTLLLLLGPALAFATRGQWLLRRLGLALANHDGTQLARRWQAALRTSFALAPLWLAVQFAEHIDRALPRGGLLCGMVYKACLIGLLLQPLLAYHWSQRLPWDVVARTRVVVW